MRLGALGLRQALLSAGGFALDLKADAFVVEIETEAAPGLLAATAQASRARLLLEGRTEWQMAPGSRFSSSLELGARVDGGDADRGAGLELGVGFEYANTRLGLSTALRVQGLLAHKQDGFEQWGASLSVQLDPGVPGQGLAPTWGQAPSSGAEALWQSGRTLQGTGTEAVRRTPGRLEVDVSYGLNLKYHSQLTPFVKLGLADGIALRLRAGIRLEHPDPNRLQLEFFVGRNAREQGAAELLLGLTSRLRF